MPKITVPVDEFRVIDPVPDSASTIKFVLVVARFRLPFSVSAPVFPPDEEPPELMIVAPAGPTVVPPIASVYV